MGGLYEGLGVCVCVCVMEHCNNYVSGHGDHILHRCQMHTEKHGA